MKCLFHQEPNVQSITSLELTKTIERGVTHREVCTVTVPVKVIIIL
jgi:hypothetical protein